MSVATTKPKLYLKEGCPFCTKLVVYMAEVNELDSVEMVVITPEDVAYIQEKAGKKPTFPVQEEPTGELTFESDALIDLYVKRSSVPHENTIAFKHFMGVFQNFGKGLSTLDDKMAFFGTAGKAMQESKAKDVPSVDASVPGKSLGKGKPRLYIKEGCPFCLRLLIFLAEKKLLATVSIEPDSKENREYLEEKSGKSPTFPCIEFGPGMVKFETSDIIALFIEQYKVKADDLFVTPYYTNGFMISYITLVKTMGHAKFVEAVEA